ncbi:MAG: ATP-binding protein [Gemmatimonadota bacterium]
MIPRVDLLNTTDCAFAVVLADQLRANREALVVRWLERISDRITLEVVRIFPSEDLLDHVPVLIDGIADYIRNPGAEITAAAAVMHKASELGVLRHAQGFGADQILREFELLGGVLFSFMARIVDDLPEPCPPNDLLACAHRLFRAVAAIERATTVKYLQLAQVQIREREQRLRGFNRALSHEIRNSLGALTGAASMLNEDFVLRDAEQRSKFRNILQENLAATHRVIDNLIELSRLDSEQRRPSNVVLQQAITESVRQLRHFAAAKAVGVRIADPLPRVEVPASIVELCTSNYLSNAIKYHDRARSDRFVTIEARVDSASQELIVEVTDNGIGIPAAARGDLFGEYYRADAPAETTGTGLGLSLVKETIAVVGGRAWAEFRDDGLTRFLYSFPLRRRSDRREA